MFLIAHIAVALAGIAGTAFANFKPTRKKIAASYVLVALTLASGTYLVVTTHSNLRQSCITGLAYLAVNLIGLASAQHRLPVAQEEDSL